MVIFYKSLLSVLNSWVLSKFYKYFILSDKEDAIFVFWFLARCDAVAKG